MVRTIFLLDNNYFCTDYHAYHFQSVQELSETDKPLRVDFARNMLRRDANDRNFINQILWTDESTFTRTTHFNQHNEHVYAEQNPHATHVRRTQHDFKLNVWSAIIDDKLIGPHFLPEIMTADRYVDFLQNDFNNLLVAAGVNMENIWFQQDGAPIHFARVSRAEVNRLFGDRVLGRFGRGDRQGIAWPPRSPDLNPLDYYLWGRMKGLVYTGGVGLIRDIDELRQRIINAFNQVRANPAEIRNAVNLQRERLEQIIAVNGEHIENIA